MADKYWPPVTKIDDAWGDRNLMCTCQGFDLLDTETE
jgi:glycine dehydrogenase